MIIHIQKVIPQLSGYFRYSALTFDMQRWGVGVVGAGIAHVAPGENYPPSLEHPADHLFGWEHGRVLDHLQLLLVTAGKGWLETPATGLRQVESGMVFALLPGVWHRYRPDPETGWEESWIEVDGPLVHGILQSDAFAPASVLHGGAASVGLDGTFAEIHRLVRAGMVGHEPELAVLTLRILAALTRIDGKNRKLTRTQRAVQAAQEYLSVHHSEPVNIEALAAKLGLAYSHLRREFRAQTGLAPWQYVVHLRLNRARRLLASGDTKLDEIAERVGFSSGFHLSLSFKQAYGLSPTLWKKTLARKEQGKADR